MLHRTFKVNTCQNGTMRFLHVPQIPPLHTTQTEYPKSTWNCHGPMQLVFRPPVRPRNSGLGALQTSSSRLQLGVRIAAGVVPMKRKTRSSGTGCGVGFLACLTEVIAPVIAATAKCPLERILGLHSDHVDVLETWVSCHQGALATQTQHLGP